MRYLSYLLGIGAVLFLLSCGENINKQNLNPEEYFAYAKKKFDHHKYFSAATEFTVIVLKFSANPIVDDAQFYLAESRFHMKEYLVAISEYQRLITDYPESPYIPEAKYKIGLCYFHMSSRPELDQEYTQKAIRAFQDFIEEYPKSKFRPEAEKFISRMRQKLAIKKMLAADTYRKMGVYDSAIIYYDIILQNYYDVPLAGDAMFWKAECQYKIKEYEKARSTFSAFISKYPSNQHVSKAKKRIKEITEILVKTKKASEQASNNGPKK